MKEDEIFISELCLVWQKSEKNVIFFIIKWENSNRGTLYIYIFVLNFILEQKKVTDKRIDTFVIFLKKKKTHF